MIRDHRYMAVMILLLVSSFSWLMADNSGYFFLELPESNTTGFCPLYTSRTLSDSGSQLSFSYGGWHSGGQLSHLFWSDGQWSAGLDMLGVTGIDIRGTAPSDEPVGETAWYTGAFRVGRSETIGRSRVYLRMNLLFEKLYYASARAASADLFLDHPVSANGTVYVSVQNFGTSEKLDKEASLLPLALRAGFQLRGSFFDAAVNGGWHRNGNVFLESLVNLNYHDMAGLHVSWSSLQQAWHVSPTVRTGRFEFGVGKYFYARGLDSPYMLSFSMDLQ